MRSLAYGYGFQMSNINGYGIIDQTMILYELFKDISTYPVKMICNPRRSGKSFHAYTIGPYYGINSPLKECNDKFFRGSSGNSPAKIYQMPGACDDYRNYVVVSFSLMIFVDNFEDSIKDLHYAITKHNAYLPKGLKELFKSTDPLEILNYIINHLSESTGKQVIVVIDEYDMPLIECNDPRLLKYYQDFYRNISANPHLKALLLFGIHEFPLDIPIKIYNQLRDTSLLPYFTYSEKEVIELFDIFRASNPSKSIRYTEQEALRDFKESCLIYTIDGVNYFNKFDVITSISSQSLHLEWIKDVSYSQFIEIVNNFSGYNRMIIRQLTNELIKGNSCTVTLNIPNDFMPTHAPIVEILMYDSILNSTNPKYEQLFYWTMLIYTGYLRAVPSGAEHEYIISIPNKSLKTFFTDELRDILVEKPKNESYSDSDESSDNSKTSGDQVLMESKLIDN